MSENGEYRSQPAKASDLGPGQPGNNSNIPKPPTRLPEEEKRGDLFKQKYGFTVLCQLNPEELGIQTAEVVTTPEGFKINGRNDTSLIVSLRSLNEIQISTLETKMRQRGTGFSQPGFLGLNESLLDVLAMDNDTVAERDFTHEQLANFLFYFPLAHDYLYQQQVADIDTIAFEYDGRTYIHKMMDYKSYQDSPFSDGTSASSDHTITCLEDGSSVSYSYLLPIMIQKYGFYGGKEVGYRIDPEKIAEVSGLTSRSTDDPVANLVQDREAHVAITTSDQISRLSNLRRVGMNLLHSPNYTIYPQTVQDVIKIAALFGRPLYSRAREEKEEAKVERQTLVSHIDTSQISATPLVLNDRTQFFLVDNLPLDFPQLASAVTEKISSFEENKELSSLIDDCIKGVMGRTDIQQAADPTYYLQLLQKIRKTPENSLLLYETMAGHRSLSSYKSGLSQMDEEKVAAFVNKLTPLFPSLRQDIITRYRHAGVMVPDEISLNDLLMNKQNYDYRQRQVDDLAASHEHLAHIQASREDIGILLTVVENTQNDLSYQCTPAEEECLKRLQIEPDLLPYAFTTPDEFVRPLEITRRLYTGIAQQRREAKLKEERHPVTKLKRFLGSLNK